MSLINGSYTQTMQYYSVPMSPQIKNNPPKEIKQTYQAMKTRLKLKYMSVSEESHSKEAAYFRTFWKRQTHGDSKYNSVCWGLWEGRMNRHHAEDSGQRRCFVGYYNGGDLSFMCFPNIQDGHSSKSEWLLIQMGGSGHFQHGGLWVKTKKLLWI